MKNPMDVLIAKHEALGLPPVCKMPRGVWSGAFGPWRFCMNATNREQPAGFSEVPVPPFRLYVEYNGWPAGILDPLGNGEFAAHETGANAETFCTALEGWDGK